MRETRRNLVTVRGSVAREVVHEIAQRMHEGRFKQGERIRASDGRDYVLAWVCAQYVQPLPRLRPLDLPSLALVEHQFDDLEREFIALERETVGLVGDRAIARRIAAGELPGLRPGRGVGHHGADGDRAPASWKDLP